MRMARLPLLLASEAINDARVEAEIMLQLAAIIGHEVVRRKPDRQPRSQVVIDARAYAQVDRIAIRIEADQRPGQPPGAGTEVAMSEAYQHIAAPRPVLPLKKPQLRTRHECVLADARRKYLKFVHVRIGSAVVTAKIRRKTQLACEVVGYAQVPRRLIDPLQGRPRTKTQIAAAKIECVLVGIGVLDNLLDAQLAARFYPGLGLAKHFGPLLRSLRCWSLCLCRCLGRLLVGCALRTQQHGRCKKCQRQKLTLSELHES